MKKIASYTLIGLFTLISLTNKSNNEIISDESLNSNIIEVTMKMEQTDWCLTGDCWVSWTRCGALRCDTQMSKVGWFCTNPDRAATCDTPYGENGSSSCSPHFCNTSSCDASIWTSCDCRSALCAC